MNYATPFSVKNGIFHDRYFMPLQFRSRDITLSLADGQDTIDMSHLLLDGINMIRLILDDNALTDEDGNFYGNALLYALDKIFEDAYQAGIYITLIPVTTRKAAAFDADVFTRQQRYFGNLFTRKNQLSGKRMHEYENLAAMEILIDREGFSDNEFDLYCGRVMMEVFIEHSFSHRVVKFYSLERGEPNEAHRKSMNKHHIKIVNADTFASRDNKDLQYESFVSGIPASVINAGIRRPGEKAWGPLAVNDAMSIVEYPHANGGGEGWLTYAADSAIELRLEFPASVQSAVFRPSLKENLPVNIDGNTIEILIPSARYGTMEINYGLNEDTPAYTVYILGDTICTNPANSCEADQIKWIEPGNHSLADLSYGTVKTLYFLPGLHEIEGDKLPLTSGHDVYLSRGAVVRAGVIAEEVVNARLLGQGILDGTTCPRDVGENKGSRMGEKWMDDAGREGFVCFFKGKKIVFDGPVIYNSNYWNIVVSGTEDAIIRNHKAITWLQNTDGIQPRSCNNLLVERCFLKCADDCIAIKTRRTLSMQSRHLVFRDLVLWNDRVGKCLEIGHTSQADLLEDILFENIDIIHNGPGIGGCIIDHSVVRDVRYENIYVEGVKTWYDFSFQISPSYYSTDEERGHIGGIYVKNFYSDSGPLGTTIKGYDENHLIENVSFSNIHYYYRHQRFNKYDVDMLDKMFFRECKLYRNIRLINPDGSENHFLENHFG